MNGFILFAKVSPTEISVTFAFMQMQTKEAVRKMMREQRQAMSLEDKRSADLSIMKQLAALIDEQQYRTVHSYLPMRGEVNITPLICTLLNADIRVVCPETLRGRQMRHWVLRDLDHVEAALYDTRHPVKVEEHVGSYDMIIVPGLAFDHEHYRLGYGGGYYDAFLAEHRAADLVGVAYEFQMMGSVPRESHDMQLDMVIVPE